jgi:hypothetical protein
MVFKLVEMAQGKWRKLNEPALIAEVLKGVRFIDGVIQQIAA